MKSRAARITKADILRLQTHLRATLNCDRVHIDAPSLPNGTAQFRIGAAVLGTLDQVDDEGERSWVATLVVLEEDLPNG